MYIYIYHMTIYIYLHEGVYPKQWEASGQAYRKIIPFGGSGNLW